MLRSSPTNPEASGSKIVAANPWPKDPAQVPDLNEAYTLPESRARTVAVLGASSSKPGTEAFEPWATELARTVVGGGGNIVSGNGNAGIMGAAFRAAAEASRGAGAGENLTLIKTPLWGDENFVDGRAIGIAASEERRLLKFARVAATVVAFPGGAGTLLEVSKLVFELAYPTAGQPMPDKIVLVGGDFWAGLKAQLRTMSEAGLLKPQSLERLVFVDDARALLAAALPTAAQS